MNALCLRLVLRFPLYLLLCSLPFAYAYAASGMNLQVAVKGDVVTCSAALLAPPDGMRRALSEGSEISSEWKISVEIKRKYWLNNSVANIAVKRRVQPDLVSESWKLVDQTSGITRRVFSLDEAIAFLTGLPDFPVVDRSLLRSGQTYLLAVSLSEREGDRQEGWWSTWTTWFDAKSGMATTEFLMP